MKQISDVGLQPEVLHCSLKDLSHVDVPPNQGVFLQILVDMPSLRDPKSEAW